MREFAAKFPDILIVATHCGTLLCLSTEEAYKAAQENTNNMLVYYKKIADQMEDKINLTSKKSAKDA